MLLLLFLGCATNLRSILFVYLLFMLVQGRQGPVVCFFVVLMAEEVRVGDKTLGGTTRVAVHALLETFMKMFMRSANFIHEAFFS